MSHEQRYGHATRARVLNSAVLVMRRDGPEAIMQAAGLTHGGFYRNFASRADLVAATIDQLAGEAQGEFRRCAEGKSAIAGLRAYVDFYLSVEHRDCRTRGCPLPGLAGDVVRLNPTLRARFADAITGLARLLAPRIRSLGHADADDLARAIVAQSVSAIALARVLGDGDASNAILHAAHASIVRRL